MISAFLMGILTVYLVRLCLSKKTDGGLMTRASQRMRWCRRDKWKEAAIIAGYLRSSSSVFCIMDCTLHPPTSACSYCEIIIDASVSDGTIECGGWAIQDHADAWLHDDWDEDEKDETAAAAAAAMSSKWKRRLMTCDWLHHSNNGVLAGRTQRVCTRNYITARTDNDRVMVFRRRLMVV